MLGKNSGIATRIQEVQPKAFATHRHCRSYHEVLKTDAMDISKESYTKDNIQRDLDEENLSGAAKFSATSGLYESYKRIFTDYLLRKHGKSAEDKKD